MSPKKARLTGVGFLGYWVRLSLFVKKLAVEIEKNGFETSGTQNIYKVVLGHRVRDIKGFEAQAAASSGNNTSLSSTTTSSKPSNQAWATALDVWQSLQ